MSPTSGVGGDETTDAFFNDMLSRPTQTTAPTRPPPPQQPAHTTTATPPSAVLGSGPAIRSRRPAAPPAAGSKRPVVGGTNIATATTAGAGQRPTAGLRKPATPATSSSSSPAVRPMPPSATAVKPTASYYLSNNNNNNDATTTVSNQFQSYNNNNGSDNQRNRENINPAATTTTTTPSFYASTAHTTPYYNTSTATTGASDHTNEWYTPSSTTTMSMTASTTATAAPVHLEPTIMNPYMPQQQPLGSMNTSLSSFTTSDTSNFMMSGDDDPYANEPPLMEELGINVEHIAWKTRAVVLPFSRSVFRMRLCSKNGFADTTTNDNTYYDNDPNPMSNPQAMAQDADLAGPIAFAVLLGVELLLAGKLSFGYIYGFGLFGCLSMTLVLNLLQPQPDVTRLTTMSDPNTMLPVPPPAAAAAANGISFWSVTSILGYALLPVNVLAAFKLLLVNNPFWKLHTLLRIFAVITIAWSTIASTRLFEQGFGFRHQRYLIAYPIALLYSAFVLITTF